MDRFKIPVLQVSTGTRIQASLRCFLVVSLCIPLWISGAGCKTESSKPGTPEVSTPSVVEKIDPAGSIIRVIEDLEARRSLGSGKLKRFLSDPDPRIRARAALAVGRIREASVYPYLSPLIKDRSPVVKASALLALGLVREDRHLETLHALVKDPVALVRQRAVEALGRIGSTRSTGVVIAMLKDPDQGVACAAADACFRLRDARAVEALLKVMKEAPPRVRYHAANALDRFLVPDVDPISNRPRDREPEILAAMEAAVPGLLGAARDEDARVATAALTALARSRVVPEDSGPIFEALGNENPQVVVAALRAVQWQANEEAVKAHEKLLSHKDAHVRWTAVKGLAHLHEVVKGAGEGDLMGGVGSVLKRVLESDPVMQIRGDALAALALIQGPDALGGFRHFLKHRDNRMRSGLCKAAGCVGGALARSLLQRLMTDEDARVRMAAVRGLSRLGGAKATHRIFRGLEDRVSGVRGQAAEVLRDLGAPEAAGPLLKAYQEDRTHRNIASSEARYRILQALVHLGGKRYVPLLDEALADPSLMVRESVIEILEILNGFRPSVEYKGPNAFAGRPVPRNRILSRRPQVILYTRRGEIHLILYPDHAPAHVRTFLALVENGFYNNMAFHRVVSNHVIQGGDPEGTGYGALDFLLPDEPSGLSFREGILGMAKVGRDTGCCQFFITLTPRPHLDGKYTIFGRVQEGMGVVRKIMVGDVITKAIWVKG